MKTNRFTMVVRKSGDGLFQVMVGDRVTMQLNQHECLGQVAQIILGMRGHYHSPKFSELSRHHFDAIHGGTKDDLRNEVDRLKYEVQTLNRQKMDILNAYNSLCGIYKGETNGHETRTGTETGIRGDRMGRYHRDSGEDRMGHAEPDYPSASASAGPVDHAHGQPKD